MKTRFVVIVVTAVIFISFGISTFSSILSLSTIVEKSSKREAELFIGTLENELSNSFSGSINISQTISNNYIKDFIYNRSHYSDEEASEYIGDYLYDLKHHFGFDTAFIVFDSTKEYFTEYGRIKTLDLKGEDDSWFYDFKESGMDMALNVDNDQANENRITVYNNIKMVDNDGNFIGVCGVGHTLNALNESIDSIEKKYGISVSLADKNGIIQIAGDDSLPGTEVSGYIKDYIVGYDFNNEFEFEKVGTGGYVIVSYIPDYNWFLCVESPEKLDDMTKTILYSLMAAFLALIIMVKIISIAMKYQEDETNNFKTDSETDMMTGLFNRRAFDSMLDSIKKSDSLRDISFVVIDVNGLKKTNDENGHLAGDEMIVKTAECIKELYENHGHAFRIGGDEFIIVILEPLDDVEAIKEEIKTRVEKCKLEHSDKLSVSVGVARGEDNLELNVSQLIELADKAMYKDKEEYYKDKRHERRTR